MLITYAEMGVVIDKFEDVDDGVILLFTVPKSSYNIDAKGEQMAGKPCVWRLPTFAIIFEMIIGTKPKRILPREQLIRIWDIRIGRLISTFKEE